MSGGSLARAVLAGPSPYQRRVAALATKHAKECALSWPLTRALGLSLLVPLSVDTDLLGTFTGEISREGTPRHVAIRKAREGMAATGLPLGLGNEGSFGPHPAISFLPCDREILVFIDDEEEFITAETLLTRETNYNQTSCSSLVGAGSFLEKTGFPSHYLVVRPEGNSDPATIRKGVHCQKELRQAITRAVSMSPVKLARLETDMRAHANTGKHIPLIKVPHPHPRPIALSVIPKINRQTGIPARSMVPLFRLGFVPIRDQNFIWA